LHALFKLTDYSSFKGNGEIMKGGFKIFGHSLVYYPSWIWNSVEEGLPSLDRNRYSVKTDTEEKELIDKMVLVMFEYADKIDFGIKDAEGSLPLHLVKKIKVILYSCMALTFFKQGVRYLARGR
jgi:hypothetical protein